MKLKRSGVSLWGHENVLKLNSSVNVLKAPEPHPLNG